MADNDRQKVSLPTLFLLPGEIFVSEQPTVVTTILGSCVALTIFHPTSRMGGICHARLPSCQANDCDNQCSHYASCSLESLLQRFAALGGAMADLEIKLFGGARLIPCARENGTSVGEKNILAAENALKGHRLQLVARDTGGRQGRKIVFDSGTGKVRVHYLQATEPAPIYFQG